MVCQKCGRIINGNVAFCPGCGTSIGGFPANAQANFQPKQRKKLSTGAVVAIVVSAAVVVIALVVLYFLFWHNGGNNSSSSQPAQTKQLTMTVNGENIPVVLSGFAYGEVDTSDYGYSAVFVGRKGTELYGVNVMFLTEEDPDCPSSNTTYDPLSSRYSDTVAVLFSYMDPSKEASIYAKTYSSGFESAQVSVGEFKPNEKLELSVTGKVSDDGLNFNFSVSGSPEFYHDSEKLSDKIESIVKSVENESSSNNSPNEVRIAGTTYPMSTTFIDLSNKGLSNGDIEDIKYLKNLTRAELSGNNLTDIFVLKNIPSLVEIDATDNNIKDISFMKNLPNLKIVVMNNNPISDISVFSGFTTLEKIWLNDTNVTDISPISRNKGLTELGFDNCNIKDISALNGMKDLELLSLINCGITDIRSLSRCTKLTMLHIDQNNISDYSPIDGLDIPDLSY